MKMDYHMVEDMYIRSSTISSGVPNTGGKHQQLPEDHSDASS